MDQEAAQMKVRERLTEIKTANVLRAIPDVVLIEVPPENVGDPIITAERNAIINANARLQAAYDDRVDAASTGVVNELNRDQGAISAIYNEFVTYGTNSTYNTWFNTLRTERKCPVDIPEHTPYDIGGGGLKELLDANELIANSLKEGHPEKHVYYYEKEPVKPLNPMKQPVVVTAMTAQATAITAQNTIIAALQRDMTRLRDDRNRGGGSGSGGGSTAEPASSKKCTCCFDTLKFTYTALNHTNAECRFIEDNPSYIGKEKLAKKIKLAREKRKR